LGQTTHVLTAKEWTASRNQARIDALAEALIQRDLLDEEAWADWITAEIASLKESIK